MSYIKKFKTKANIDILKYEKSITINGQPIFNGYPFNDNNIKVIQEALNIAFVLGKDAKIREIKEVLTY